MDVILLYADVFEIFYFFRNKSCVSESGFRINTYFLLTDTYGLSTRSTFLGWGWGCDCKMNLTLSQPLLTRAYPLSHTHADPQATVFVTGVANGNIKLDICVTFRFIFRLTRINIHSLYIFAHSIWMMSIINRFCISKFYSAYSST